MWVRFKPYLLVKFNNFYFSPAGGGGGGGGEAMMGGDGGGLWLPRKNIKKKKKKVSREPSPPATGVRHRAVNPSPGGFSYNIIFMLFIFSFLVII